MVLLSRNRIYTYRILVFNQALIVSAQTDQEQDTCNILETMNPFSSLALLSTDIDHKHLMITQLEECLCDTNCSRTGMDDILFVGGICWVEKAVKVGKEVN